MIFYPWRFLTGKKIKNYDCYKFEWRGIIYLKIF